MGKAFSKISVVAVIVLTSWQSAASSICSYKGYLATLHPAFLRFQAVRLFPVNLPPLPEEPDPVDFPLPSPTNAPSGIMLNSAHSGIPGGFLQPSSLFIDHLAENIEAQSVVSDTGDQGTNQPHTAASDLLGVPPEMLVEYFRPVHDLTNNAFSRMLVPIQFTPAQPVSSGSRAIYKTP